MLLEQSYELSRGSNRPGTTEDDTLKPFYTNQNISPVLYLAAALGQSAALAAASTLLFSPTGFLMVLLPLTALGAWFSYWVRAKELGDQNTLMRLGVAVQVAIAAILYFLVARRSQMIPWTYGGPEQGLVAGLGIMAALGAFFWLSGPMVVFSTIWSIALLGLSATIAVSGPVLGGFIFFLLTAIFLLIHQNSLRLSPRLLTIQVLTAAALWATTLILGLLVAVPLQMVGRNLSLNAVLQKMEIKEKKPILGKIRLSFESRDSTSVGLGPVADDDTLLLTVKSPRPLYWRARTFATLEGNQWRAREDLSLLRDLLPIRTENNQKVFRLPQGDAGPVQKTEKVTAEFHSLGQTQAIYHLAETQQVRCTPEQISPHTDGTFSVLYNDDYAIDAAVSIATPDDLNQASTQYPSVIKTLYLTIPDSSLTALAEEATRGKTKPYDRAEAIRQFVSQRCTYNLEARAVPQGRNPAEFFLNESREGYCDLFATATVMLCRAAGIPARYVTGFNSGEPDPEHPNSYLLRERNHHAWCEAYFVGYGWISLDATALTITTNTAVVAPTTAQAKKQKTTLPSGPVLLGLLGVLGLGYVVASETIKRRLHVASSGLTRTPAERDVERAYLSALRQAQKAGVPRAAAMTTQAHLSLIAERYGASIADLLSPIAQANDQLRFDPTPVSQTTATEAIAEAKRFEAKIIEAKKAAT
jgi:transglutaminase-like putative cysteine protease